MVRAEELMQAPVLSVSAEGSLLDALGRMDRSGYAQLPVTKQAQPTGVSGVVGTLRGEDVRHVYRKLIGEESAMDVRAGRAGGTGPDVRSRREELSRIAVGDVCGPPLPVISGALGLSDILQRLWTDHAMLVDAGERYGIITATDVLRHARPLLLVEELESRLRAFIEAVLAAVDEHWWMNRVPKDVRTRCEGRLHAELSKEESGRQHPPSSLLAFAGFGDYLTIIHNRRNWAEGFDRAFRSKVWVGTRMERVQDIRNAVAHSRNLDAGEVATLERYVHDLLSRMEPYVRPRVPAER